MKKSKQDQDLSVETMFPDNKRDRSDFRVAFDELRSEAMDLDDVNLDEINEEIVAFRAKLKK